MTTGRRRVRSSARNRRRTSRPSSLGSFRSSRTTCGRLGSRPLWRPVPKRYSSASTPSRATTTSFPILFFFSARSVSVTSSGLSSTSRMVLALIQLPPDVGSEPSYGEVERGPLLDRPLAPHPATVAADDAAHRRQSDSRALELAGGVETLKRPEQLVGVRHVEPGPVVPHVIHRPRLVPSDPEFDARPGMLGGVLPGVAQQVLEDQAEQSRVTVDLDSRGDDELDLTLRVTVLQVRGDGVGEIAQVDALPADLGTRHPRQLQ